MALTPNYFTPVMASLSEEMITKLEYATQTFIKELLILKNDEEEKGNTATYSWLNIVDHRGRIQHIQGIIERMFHNSNAEVLASVVSDYFVPEDVVMVRRFVDDYYIHVYKCTQENCDSIKWANRTNAHNIFNTELYSNMMFEMGIYIYMNIHQKFVINQLYNVIDNNAQLK
jgi:hypothetical protein